MLDSVLDFNYYVEQLDDLMGIPALSQQSVVVGEWRRSSCS